MTKEDFIASGQRIFGSGWQRRLAERLEMRPETINRYARGGLVIPATVALAVKHLEGAR
jgi:hypothetical protein